MIRLAFSQQLYSPSTVGQAQTRSGEAAWSGQRRHCLSRSQCRDWTLHALYLQMALDPFQGQVQIGQENGKWEMFLIESEVTLCPVPRSTGLPQCDRWTSPTRRELRKRFKLAFACEAQRPGGGTRGLIQLLTLWSCPLCVPQRFCLAWTKLCATKSQRNHVTPEFPSGIIIGWLCTVRDVGPMRIDRHSSGWWMPGQIFRIRVLILSHYHWQAAAFFLSFFFF